MELFTGQNYYCYKCNYVREEGKKGRSYNTNKIKAVVVVKLSEKNQVKRVYIKAIDDYSAKSLTPIFEQHINKTAKVVAHKWKGYSSLTRNYYIKQIPSASEKNFKQLYNYSSNKIMD